MGSAEGGRDGGRDRGEGSLRGGGAVAVLRPRSLHLRVGALPATSQAPGSTAGHPDSTLPLPAATGSQCQLEGSARPAGTSTGIPVSPWSRPFLWVEGPRVRHSSVTTCLRFPTPSVEAPAQGCLCPEWSWWLPCTKVPKPGHQYWEGLSRQPWPARAGALGVCTGRPVSVWLTGWPHTPLCLRVLSVPHWGTELGRGSLRMGHTARAGAAVAVGCKAGKGERAPTAATCLACCCP